MIGLAAAVILATSPIESVKVCAKGYDIEFPEKEACAMLRIHEPLNEEDYTCAGLQIANGQGYACVNKNSAAEHYATIRVSNDEHTITCRYAVHDDKLGELATMLYVVPEKKNLPQDTLQLGDILCKMEATQ